MTPPRFQFTIQGLLWFTFWSAASISLWIYYARLRPDRFDPIELYFLPAYIGAWTATGGAVGALFGKTARGLLIGIAIGVFTGMLLSGYLTAKYAIRE